MKFTLNPDFPDAKKEDKWNQFRIWRDTQLRLTDWTQLPDAPLNEEEKEEYRLYRDFLRNAPQNYSDVEDITFVKFVRYFDYKLEFLKEKRKL